MENFTKFKVGDKVLIKAGESADSRRLNGKIKKIIGIVNSKVGNVVDGSTGVWLKELTLVKTSLKELLR